MKPVKFSLLLIALPILLFSAPGCRHGTQARSTHAATPRAAAQPTTTQPARPTTSLPASRPSAPALPFAAEIEAFERLDRENPPPQDAILFVGSSSIRLWKTLNDDFPGLTVINRGFGGSQVADSARYADRIVTPYRPKVVVLYAGDNDLAAGKSPGEVLSDFQAFVAGVHAALPDTPVLYLSIKPSVARWHLIDQIRRANQLIRAYAATKPGKVIYVDVFTPMLTPDRMPRPDLLVADGLHLNEEGYRLWTSILRPVLERLWQGHPARVER